MKRYTVHFDGQVQGVGFRFTALEIAQTHPIAGYVQNLPDGRVKLVAETDAQTFDAYMKRLRERLGRHIRDEQIDETPATGEWGPAGAMNNFTIKY